jgi:hypothetical protein
VIDLLGLAGLTTSARLLREPEAEQMESVPRAYVMAHKPVDAAG